MPSMYKRRKALPYQSRLLQELPKIDIKKRNQLLLFSKTHSILCGKFSTSWLNESSKMLSRTGPISKTHLSQTACESFSTVFQPSASSLLIAASLTLGSAMTSVKLMSKGSGMLQKRQLILGGLPRNVASCLSALKEPLITLFRVSASQKGILSSGEGWLRPRVNTMVDRSPSALQER